MKQGFSVLSTMTNQIAIRLHTRPQTEVICLNIPYLPLRRRRHHVQLHASVKLLDGDYGKITASKLQEISVRMMCMPAGHGFIGKYDEQEVEVLHPG